ncbi:MAG: hypothetical protein HYZ74_01620 [Elusimicrobia bacterium]|nr:hypothetical protein [Elusimicrobiota bacterium]
MTLKSPLLGIALLCTISSPARASVPSLKPFNFTIAANGPLTVLYAHRAALIDQRSMLTVDLLATERLFGNEMISLRKSPATQNDAQIIEDLRRTSQSSIAGYERLIRYPVAWRLFHERARTKDALAQLQQTLDDVNSEIATLNGAQAAPAAPTSAGQH